VNAGSSPNWYGLRITFLAKRLASAVHQNAQLTLASPLNDEQT